MAGCGGFDQDQGSLVMIGVTGALAKGINGDVELVQHILIAAPAALGIIGIYVWAFRRI